MQRYVLDRFFQALVALVILSIVIFVVGRISGDPIEVMLPPEATEEARDTLRQALGLDKPWPVQYYLWASHAVRGDLGRGFKSGMPVMDLIKQRLPNSLKLAAASLLITIVIGFPLGVIAAVKKGTPVDTLAKIVAVLGQSLPTFWMGIVLIQIFAVWLHILPASGMGGLDHYILPAFTLGWFVVAGVMRLLRSSMLEVLDSEFVKMARIKGVSARAVIWKHALRNALIPVLTFGGVYFAILITAAILVEVVFAWPGMGRLVYEAIIFRDFPIIQGVVLTTACVVVLVNLLVDLVYAYIDPRIRFG
jgi:ABC-type dipeptide/oligopeptide/nickel transport system permease component